MQHSEAGLLQGSRAGEWEGSNTPSNRVWLGNISATATLRSVRSVFSKFGPLTDAAVFPARIGPLGYAFVNFEKVSDAAGAYQALNNVVLPALTGCKQLKMRFKPAKVRCVSGLTHLLVQHESHCLMAYIVQMCVWHLPCQRMPLGYNLASHVCACWLTEPGFRHTW